MQVLFEVHNHQTAVSCEKYREKRISGKSESENIEFCIRHLHISAKIFQREKLSKNDVV